MNCESEILYQNRDGAVLQCPECGIIQLAFGTSHHIFQRGEFEKFRKIISRERLRPHRGVEPSKKRYSLPIKDHSTRLWLTAIELEDLYALVEQAVFIRSIDEILSET